MPVTIEKKLIGPEKLPGYEKAGPLPQTPKILPWWLVFGREIPPCHANERGERDGFVIYASSQLPFGGYRLTVDPAVAPHFRIRLIVRPI